MSFRIFVEPQQGASYSQLASFAKEVDDTGFDALFRSDHYVAMGSASGLPGPTDAWVTLAGWARDTTRLRLGTLVTSATFRLPGPLAIAVAQVDEMSGGRVEIGLGAGWYTVEHTAYGIPFPALGERFDRLEEQLTILDGLWRTPVGETYSFAGRHYQLENSPALPKTIQQPGVPIIVGGMGPSRTPALAARFAAEFNTPFAPPEAAQIAFERVNAACTQSGRDPQTLIKSSALTVVCGRTPEEISRRVERAGWDEAALRRAGACGTPQEVAERLVLWRTAGAARLYLQVLDLDDLGHLSDLAEACQLVDA